MHSHHRLGDPHEMTMSSEGAGSGVPRGRPPVGSGSFRRRGEDSMGAVSPNMQPRRAGNFQAHLRIPVSPATNLADTPRSNVGELLSAGGGGHGDALASFRLSRPTSFRTTSEAPSPRGDILNLTVGSGLFRQGSFRDGLNQMVAERVGRAPRDPHATATSTPGTPSLRHVSSVAEIKGGVGGSAVVTPPTPGMQMQRQPSILGQLNEMDALREDLAAREEEVMHAVELGEKLLLELREKDEIIEQQHAELQMFREHGEELEKEVHHLKRRSTVAYGDKVTASLALEQMNDIQEQLDQQETQMKQRLADERENLTWVHEQRVASLEDEKTDLQSELDALTDRLHAAELTTLAGHEAQARVDLLASCFFDTARYQANFTERLATWLDADALTFRNERATLEGRIAQLVEDVAAGQRRAHALEHAVAETQEALRDAGLRENKVGMELTRVQGELERSRARCDGLTREIQQLGGEHAADLDEFLRTTERLNQVEEALTVAQREADESKHALTTAEATNTELSANLARAKAEADDLRTAEEELRHTAQRLEQTLRTAETTHAEHVKRANRDRDVMVSQHHTEIDHHRTTIEGLETAQQQLQATLTTASTEGKQAAQDAAALRRQVESLQKKLVALEAEREALQGELSKVQDAAAERARTATAHAAEVKSLTAFNRSLLAGLVEVANRLDLEVGVALEGTVQTPTQEAMRVPSFGNMAVSRQSSPAASPRGGASPRPGKGGTSQLQQPTARTVTIAGTADVVESNISSFSSSPASPSAGAQSSEALRRDLSDVSLALRSGVTNTLAVLQEVRQRVVWFEREMDRSTQREQRRDQVILELETRVHTESTAVDEKTTELRALEDRHSTAQRELKESKDSLQDFAERLAETEEIVRAKDSTVNRLTSELASQNFQIQELQSKVTVTDTSLKQQQGEVARLQKERAAIDAAADDAQATVLTAQEAARRARHDSDRLADELDKERSLHKDLKRAREKAERTAQERLIDAERAAADRDSMQKTLERAQADLADAQAMYNDIHRNALARETDLQTRSGEISRLEDTNAHLRSLIDTLQGDVAAVRLREDEAKRALEELQIVVEATHAKQQQTERRRARLEQEVHDARDQQAALQRELDASVAEWMEKHDTVHAELKDTERDLRDARRVCEEKQTAAADLATRSEEQVAEAQDTIASQQQTLAHLEQRIENLERELKRVRELREGELTHNRAEKVQLLSRIEGLETEVLELESRSDAVKDALERKGKREADAATDAVRELRTEMERKELNERVLADQLARTQALLEERDTRCFNYEASLNTTAAELEELKANLSRFEASRHNDLRQAQEDVASLRAENRSLTQEVEKLRALESAGRTDPIVGRMLAKIDALRHLEDTEATYAEKLAAYQQSVAELLVLNETPPAVVVAATRSASRAAGGGMSPPSAVTPGVPVPLVATASPRMGSTPRSTTAGGAGDALNLKFESLQSRLLRLDDELRSSQQYHHDAEADMARTAQLLRQSAAARSPHRGLASPMRPPGSMPR